MNPAPKLSSAIGSFEADRSTKVRSPGGLAIFILSNRCYRFYINILLYFYSAPTAGFRIIANFRESGFLLFRMAPKYLRFINVFDVAEVMAGCIWLQV